MADFSFAVFSNQENSRWQGTLHYMAPEYFYGFPWNEAVDWWALGIILCYGLCGEHPYYTKDVAEAKEQLSKQMLVNLIDAPYKAIKENTNLTPAARSLLAGLLEKDMTKRLGSQAHGVASIKDHAWFQGFNFDGYKDGGRVPDFEKMLTEYEIPN